MTYLRRSETAVAAAEAIRAGAESIGFRGQLAVRLPIELRRERFALLLEAWAELTGGAKKALHYGDRAPVLFVLLPMAGGVNPLGFVIDGAEDGSGLRVRGDVLRQELAAWAGEWEAPARVGWRPGFRDDLRKQFEADLAAEIDAGLIVLDHPRTLLRDLAAAVRSGRHDGWFDDPTLDSGAVRPAG
jgi:CRISPR-associated protein Cst2